MKQRLVFKQFIDILIYLKLLLLLLKKMSDELLANKFEVVLDWLQSLKHFFTNVSFHILVASLTLNWLCFK